MQHVGWLKSFYIFVVSSGDAAEVIEATKHTLKNAPTFAPSLVE
jgi:hypothetical protein|tara:strand:- start:221 stop:352 length:132 start_codon:yes stop_codon:yes gene_type:complete